MQIVPFPHPALRRQSVDVARIDDTLRAIVRSMFDLMYEARGIGLAANQVGLPIRLFVINPSGEKDNPEEELVFINPVIQKRKGQVVGEEGCLSLPGLYGDVVRSKEIVVEAFDLDGQGFRVKLDDLPARVVQHEADHLDGVLFIDRVDDLTRAELNAKLNEMTSAYRQEQSAGRFPGDEELARELDRMASGGMLAAPTA
ncbi:MAG: peptide deformylase [Planctomyces sp.]|nr:peptide deformylase [Planctomyces sp.]